jgi:hypothetical protein
MTRLTPFPFALLLVCCAPALARGATHQTRNFRVVGPTARAAYRVAIAAEWYRGIMALRWLGRKLPDWKRPCPVEVRITLGRCRGATSFAFDRGRVMSQNMVLEGTLEQVVKQVLPHEVTHAVLAHHFRRPVPRWADEGAAIHAEPRTVWRHHDALLASMLKEPGRAYPLKRLFRLTEYPRDVMVVYAQGQSVTRFLIDRRGRADFLAFVADGLRAGWDAAARRYGYGGVNELEKAWLAHVRSRKARVVTAP